MKSIKEKADEYAFIKQGIDSVGIQFREFNINKHDGFVAGANYVLEQLEEFLNLYGVYSMTSSTRAYLKDMIKQLKSNQ